MNVNEEFAIPVSYSLSSQQVAALTEFIGQQGFDGKVGMHLLPPPTHPSIRESTTEDIAGGIRLLIDGEKTLPFSSHQALTNWLQKLLQPVNSRYLGTTVCHSSDEKSLRTALNAIAAAVI